MAWVETADQFLKVTIMYFDGKLTGLFLLMLLICIHFTLASINTKYAQTNNLIVGELRYAVMCANRQY